MEGYHVTLLAAFTAGMLSLLSPCVLAALPSYTTFLATNATGANASSRRSWASTCIFLSGFVVVFLTLGAAASSFGRIMLEYQHLIRNIGAIFMIIMGIHLAGLLPVPILRRESQPRFTTTRVGPWELFLLGITSTAAWTPCNGPLLASLLVYASTSGSLPQGIALLFIYAMGFCIPFILLTGILQQYLLRIPRLSKVLHLLQRSAGVVLAIIGLLIYFDLLK